MNRLEELAGRTDRRVAGVMSGTSMDAIDVAICRIEGAGPGSRVELERFLSTNLDERLSARLHDPNIGLRDVAELHVLVGEAFASAISASADGLDVDLIGSHGQTVYHYSRLPGAMRSTLQIGDGDTIAERLGIPVVSDFRCRDIAAGGEGAPLTPYADFVLFGGKPGVAVLNLGGIANLTLLGSRLEDVTGFDTGPANAPLDRIARSEFGAPFDRDGKFARAGTHHAGAARRLAETDPFVQLPPPKSTGTEVYGDPFVDTLRAQSGKSGADLIRLATEFVVESIRCQLPPGVGEVILAGGGAANTFLRELLQARLDGCRIALSDAYGVPYKAREAMAFAILANDAVCGLPTSLPKVTGANHARTLGKISLP